ncbi:MAG: cobaltochelatase subunit CobN, partial [Phenylobacterium sp.]|uniref:cobaltochelatase subunit CobN n=1 Tax=Phenylobacterium sp. TaxID=1871053 RepID=UPI0027F3BFC8|nr:cobaltochelatase subunit CobN [Phenylobacterium sp.]
MWASSTSPTAATGTSASASPSKDLHPAGPSGAPRRGRLDVLPTGRNFYSVDV